MHIGDWVVAHGFGWKERFGENVLIVHHWRLGVMDLHRNCRVAVVRKRSTFVLRCLSREVSVLDGLGSGASA